MMKRPINLWMGFLILFMSFAISQECSADVHYKVKRGDSLFKISKQYKINIQELKEANNLPGSAITANQLLIIPQRENKKKIATVRKAIPAKTKTYIVKKGDSLYAIAKKSGCSMNDLRHLNHLKSSVLKTGQEIVLSEAVFEDTEANKARVGVSAGAGNVGFSSDTDEDLDEELEEDDVPAESGFSKGDVDFDSKLLSIWRSRDEQKLFVKVATGFLGTPYRLGGQSVRGIDCSAFVRKIYEFFGVQLPRTAREQAFVGMSIARDQLEEGDLVFFNTRRAFGHVGIYIGNNEFVHASYKQKQVRIDSLMGYFDRRFVKAVRLKKLDEGV